MKRILVAYDGSRASQKALLKACELAKPDTKINVIYVIDKDEITWPTRIDIALIWPGNIQELENNILEIHKKHAEKLLSRAEKILQRKGRKAQVFYRVGEPPAKIIEEAEKLKCDLIAVGSRSKSSIAFLLGSVAQKVVVKSSIPVLVVKD